MKKGKTSALSSVEGIVFCLDNQGKQPTIELLDMVRGLATDAISVLKEPDPLKQKVGFILLAIQQSTKLTEVKLRSKPKTLVQVVDADLYEWALREIHLMAGAG
jgi:hypothetical protein